MTADRGSDGAPALDEISRALINRLQAHIPMVSRPFFALGEELGMREDEVIERTQALLDARLIREIGAIFDGRALGYDSCLVAAKYAPGDLETAAGLISAHPGVSHNYQRAHDFNLWYTLAVPPGSSVVGEAAVLHRLTGALSTRPLPSLRMFKLGVKLDMDDTPSEARSAHAPAGATAATSRAPTAREIATVRAFQEPFQVVPRPFDAAAQRHGFASAEDLLETADELHCRGALRRFSAVLRHRVAGFSANGMAVWKASQEECEAAGPIMASFARVSHCYQRPVYEDWPYSLFTMIHGRSQDEVQDCVAAIQRETGLREYRVLYSLVEYKKARVRYFSEGEDARRPGGGAPAVGDSFPRESVRTHMPSELHKH